MRAKSILSILVLTVIFSAPALADQITVFAQPLAYDGPPIGPFNVPTTLFVGLALCEGCSTNPLVASTLIGPFGPITAQPVSETFTVGPSNPAFTPIVNALQGHAPPQPPFLEFVPFVRALDAHGSSEFLENGYGVGPAYIVPSGTVQSLSIVIPEISKFEFRPSVNLWVAVGPDAKQVYVSWVAQGVNLPEPGTFALLAWGIGIVAIWLAWSKLRG